MTSKQGSTSTVSGCICSPDRFYAQAYTFSNRSDTIRSNQS